jgi:hypothetical protein
MTSELVQDRLARYRKMANEAEFLGRTTLQVDTREAAEKMAALWRSLAEDIEANLCKTPAGTSSDQGARPDESDNAPGA